MGRLSFLIADLEIFSLGTCSFLSLEASFCVTLVVFQRTRKVVRKLTKIAMKTHSPLMPAMKTRKTKLVRVMMSIAGQIRRATVINSGSGSALSAVLMIRKDLEAPQESDNSDVTNEKIWVLLILPVLRTMKTWVKQI